jgi:uncharacterized surface protein with fasciclin (FAS1) repeats
MSTQFPRFRVHFLGFSVLSAVCLLAGPTSAEIVDRSADRSMAAPAPLLLLAQAEGDIVDVATADGSFQVLLGLLQELGMAEDLRGYGRFTVFAPTDAAFAAVPPAVMQALQSDRELMAKVLAYHVVAGNSPLSARDLRSAGSLTTLERSTVTLDRRRRTLYVNEARVIAPDIEASNGVIHAIDQVLIPPDVMRDLGL